MYNKLIKFSLFLFFGFLFSAELNAQRILGQFSVGMNLTQVDGDEFYGFHKVGLNIGPGVLVPFGKNKKWSVGMELLYSQKGSHHSGSSDTTTYNLKIDYLEIPVLVHFTDKKVISGGVGFSYGQLINYKETKNSFFDSLYTYQNSMSNFDISVIADLQIRLWNRLWANLRYQYSVKSNHTVLIKDYTNTKNQYTRDQYNNVITLRLTWVFNQEVPKKAKKVTED
jgi:hypothetical protein